MLKPRVGIYSIPNRPSRSTWSRSGSRPIIQRNQGTRRCADPILEKKTGSGSDPREKTGSIPDSPKTTRIRIVCNFHIKIKKSFDIKDNLFDLLIYIITLVDKYYIKSSILEGSYTLMLGPDPDPSKKKKPDSDPQP